MGSKIILSLIVGFFIVFIGFIVAGEQKPQTLSSTSYNLQDKEKPQAEIKETSADLGAMKVSDEKYKDFIVKNIGSRNLVFSNITSSCNCTFGQVIYDGEESPEFGMHSQSIYSKEILPGKEAVIRVIYRPFVMPVYGYVEREVYVVTNDPAKSKLTLRVTATVK